MYRLLRQMTPYCYPHPLRQAHFLHLAEWLLIEFCLSLSTYHTVTYRKGQYYVYSHTSGNIIYIHPNTFFSPTFHTTHYILCLSNGMSLPAWLFNSEHCLRSALSKLPNEALLAAFENLHLDIDSNVSVSKHVHY